MADPLIFFGTGISSAARYEINTSWPLLGIGMIAWQWSGSREHSGKAPPTTRVGGWKEHNLCITASYFQLAAGA